MPKVTSPYRLGALRTVTVARLAGVSLRQLGYWHRTDMIRAHAVPGGPGHPRLYSWVDYMKIRAAKNLLDQGLHTRRIRAAIDFLEADAPEWYLCPLSAFQHRVFIRLPNVAVDVAAEKGRQALLPLVEDLLATLRREGPLGKLHRFSEYVDMDPDTLAGNPVLKGRRLETRFIATLTDYGVSIPRICTEYGLNRVQVRHALDFEQAVA